MKGLSSTALANTTSLVQADESLSLVRSAACLIILPHIATASMLMPALVDATLTLEHILAVDARALGMLSMNSLS